MGYYNTKVNKASAVFGKIKYINILGSIFNDVHDKINETYAFSMKPNGQNITYIIDVITKITKVRYEVFAKTKKISFLIDSRLCFSVAYTKSFTENVDEFIYDEHKYNDTSFVYNILALLYDVSSYMLKRL